MTYRDDRIDRLEDEILKLIRSREGYKDFLPDILDALDYVALALVGKEMRDDWRLNRAMAAYEAKDKPPSY